MSAVALVVCALLSSASTKDPKHEAGDPKHEAGDPKHEAGGPKHEARAFFLRGNEHVREQAYEAALADYRAAYALFPSPKILLNTGTLLQLLGRTAEAVQTYAAYLEDPDADPARREEVEALIAKLDLEIVHLRIEVDPYPAEIAIDGAAVGVAAPRLEHRVEPGVHEVVARLKDSQSTLVELTTTAGEMRDVQLRFAAPAPELACESSLAPPVLTWVSAAVSLVAVGAGAYYGNRVRDDSVGYDEAQTLATRANVAYGIAAVVAAVAGGAWIIAAHSGGPCPSPREHP